MNHQFADWAFICTVDYKDIDDRDKRIEQFHKDGIDIITWALGVLGYNFEIEISKRYRRHL